MGINFSIVMNCFNGERFLREALESVLSQSYENWELIFVDNCSVDQSERIFKSYVDHRFKYFKTETNLSLGAARQFALNHAKGDWIAFLDTDDVWNFDKLEVQAEHVTKYPCLICYAGIREIDEAGRELITYLPKQERANLRQQLIHFDINMVTPIVLREALEKYQISFNPKIEASEEYNLFLRIMAKGDAQVIDRVLGDWRQYPNTLTSRTISFWATDRRITIKQLINENPSIEVNFKNAIEIALARADYYEAQDFFQKGDADEARICLKRAARTEKLFWFLWIISFNKLTWNSFHNRKFKRKLSQIVFIIRIIEKR
jgi:glycosyltransferase involved in cell wall biosynthesis